MHLRKKIRNHQAEVRLVEDTYHHIHNHLHGGYIPRYPSQLCIIHFDSLWFKYIYIYKTKLIQIPIHCCPSVSSCSRFLPTDNLRLRLKTKHLLAQENIAIFSWEFHGIPFKDHFKMVRFSNLAVQPMGAFWCSLK